jgi:phosphoribosylcarboxyaminoimidazole (NCAIR) mutase
MFKLYSIQSLGVNAVEMLEQFGIPYEVQVVSAHRTPDLMFEYANTASERGLKVIQNSQALSECIRACRQCIKGAFK